MARACSAILPAYAEPKPEDAALALQTLEDFNSVEQTSARKPIMDAEASYRSKLEKFQKTAQDAGNLKSVLAAALTPKPGARTTTPGTEEIEIWKKRALEEFPALKQPESELTRSVKALKEKKEATIPSFFKNPQWPYLLAKEASSALLPPKFQDLLADTKWTPKDSSASYKLFAFTKNGEIERVNKDAPDKRPPPTPYLANEAEDTITFTNILGKKVVLQFSKDRQTLIHESSEYMRSK